jgi:hydroxymethylpyrimidine pyrophosphatase-like HAD family hydrolase
LFRCEAALLNLLFSFDLLAKSPGCAAAIPKRCASIKAIYLLSAGILQSLGMNLSAEQLVKVEEFLEISDFVSKGAVITDLDGTAVHEVNGMTIIHTDVEAGLKLIYDAGRPVVINTLRFPLSVIRTFGREWYKISNAPIPVVLLNGSQLGYIVKYEDNFAFEQIAAFPMRDVEINKVLTTIERFNDVLDNVVLFYYPQDWKKGEMIWTANKEKISLLQEKYRSASTVFSTPVEELSRILLNESICMILLLIDVPGDRLMAYQHTERNNFFTREKVDKLYGSVHMARHLGFNLEDAIGAGDSGMDVFLAGTGLSVHVRNAELPFKGKVSTISVPDFHDFGYLLRLLVEKHKEQSLTPQYESSKTQG